ncbi:MAG: hypothetical protein WD830_07560 [Chloroflexota bacterium]
MTHDLAGRLARWLLIALAVDLLLTRVLVRLAIFVPKGEPWASVGAILGRIGAATDALVLIFAVLLLLALLIRSGHAGGWAERALLVGVGVLAAGGVVLLFSAPPPTVALGLDLLVVVIAMATGLRLARQSGIPALARGGLVVLAAAVAIAGLSHAFDAWGAIAGLSDVWKAPSTLILGVVGQLTFVVGAGLTGLAGVICLRRSPQGASRPIALGSLVAAAMLAAAVFAPATFGALAIWGVGLSGAVAAVFVAFSAGLSVAGLPALHRIAPRAAVGSAIVLLSGYGLAASGLVLAGMLGLFIAAQPSSQRH